jgi:hypothetical protein
VNGIQKATMGSASGAVTAQAGGLAAVLAWECPVLATLAPAVRKQRRGLSQCDFWLARIVSRFVAVERRWAMEI